MPGSHWSSFLFIGTHRGRDGAEQTSWKMNETHMHHTAGGCEGSAEGPHYGHLCLGAQGGKEGGCPGSWGFFCISCPNVWELSRKAQEVGWEALTHQLRSWHPHPLVTHPRPAREAVGLFTAGQPGHRLFWELGVEVAGLGQGLLWEQGRGACSSLGICVTRRHGVCGFNPCLVEPQN